ncbi:hypothetical protein KIN20_034877 [Parelaphostrongylus tenuis]|uniref:Uncharacterized protein n=1 Tax=Parelaphostrongylus tenuis TaxID=148309 RepID=A0AAD5RAE0_PARTN|nr:hypothetical protein KIN20_034877 [Parelaphostrongylus tenuis]
MVPSWNISSCAAENELSANELDDFLNFAGMKSLMSLSRLRSPRFVEQVGVQPRGIHPYTPPPILSPMRNGSGLFWQIAKNLGHPAQAAPSICARNGQNGHPPGIAYHVITNKNIEENMI